MVARVAGGPVAGDSVAEEADALRRRALTLVDEDAAAYTDVIAARRTREPGPLQHALARATASPLEVVRAAAAVLALGERVAASARPRTLPDLATAGALAAAALEGAILMVRANVADVTDDAAAGAARTAADDLAARAAEARRRLGQTIGGRMERPA